MCKYYTCCVKYTMTTQMVDIFPISFDLQATYQPFASPLRVYLTSITNFQIDCSLFKIK